MRQLLADPGGDTTVDLTTAYLPPPLATPHDPHPTAGADGPSGARRRPWTMANMVASVDGAMEVAGHSAGLSNPGDRAVFHTLRSLADVIVVGAGTARTERYGPARIAEDLTAARLQRNQSPTPPVALVTNSGRLDPDLPVFNPTGTDTSPPPIVVTCAQGAEAAGTLGGSAEVVVVGDAAVDLTAMFDVLGDRGMRVAICEGGPILNASMMALGLLDELCLTLSPLAVGGSSGRIVAGVPALPGPAPLSLVGLLEHDSSLFTRWRVGPT